MKIMPTSDLALIEKTMKHPYVFPRIVDDFMADKRDEWKPEKDEKITYLAVYDDTIYFGLFIVIQQGPILHEIHSCLLPTAYGLAAIAALEMALQWVFCNTSCRRIVAGIPDDNVLAYKLAKNAGMTDYGLNPDCVLRGGKLRSVKLVGISKGAEN